MPLHRPTPDNAAEAALAVTRQNELTKKLADITTYATAAHEATLANDPEAAEGMRYQSTRCKAFH